MTRNAILPVYRENFLVGDASIDVYGHVNNIEYLRWMQTIATRHSDANGWSFARYRELGAGWVVRSHRIDYLAPAFSGDEINAKTWVADLKRSRSTRHYRFSRTADGLTLAQAETDWVFVDMTTGRPVSIPEAVSSCFQALTEPPA